MALNKLLAVTTVIGLLHIACSSVYAQNPRQHSQATYTVDEISFPDQEYSEAHAINQRGDVVGIVKLKHGQIKAFIYADQKAVILPQGNALYGEAWGINGNGIVAGERAFKSLHGFNTDRACMWQAKNLRDVSDHPDKLPNCFASGINDAGCVVGSLAVSSTWIPCYWDKKGIIHILRIPDQLTAGEAMAINSEGLIIGGATSEFYIDMPASVPVAIVWFKDKAQVLATPDNIGASVSALNDRGNIVGWLETPTANVPCVWISPESRCMVLPSDDNAEPSAINNVGVIVGAVWFSGKNPQAVLWKNGRMIKLDSLIDPKLHWSLCDATGINDWNQITGWGIRNGRKCAYRLRPILPN